MHDDGPDSLDATLVRLDLAEKLGTKRSSGWVTEI